MVTNIIETLWDYFIAGDLWNFFATVFNTYFPFGSFFWLLGLVFFVVTYLKSKSLAWGGAVAGVFFVITAEIPNLVINVYSQMGLRYFGVILAMISGYHLYKIIRG